MIKGDLKDEDKKMGGFEMLNTNLFQTTGESGRKILYSVYRVREIQENIAVLFISLKLLSQRTAQLLLSESEAGKVVLH